eukprot:13048969-Alexandrium_andersonii.AAC.1
MSASLVGSEMCIRDSPTPSSAEVASSALAVPVVPEPPEHVLFQRHSWGCFGIGYKQPGSSGAGQFGAFEG